MEQPQSSSQHVQQSPMVEIEDNKRKENTHESPLTSIGLFTFLRTYSRRHDENDPKSTIESWDQAITRVVTAANTQLNIGFSEQELAEVYNLLVTLKFSVAGRFLWQLGTKTVDRMGLTSLQNCFQRDTLFKTNDGLKSFCDFEDGDSVVVVGRDGLQNAVVRRCGKQQLYRLTVRYSDRYETIITTANHRWITHSATKSVHLEEHSLVEKTTISLTCNDRLFQPNTKGWRVLDVKHLTDAVEDVWCVSEPIHEEFTLGCGILTKNCASTVVNDPVKPFTWSMNFLMLGAGIGVRLLPHDVDTFPIIKRVTATRHDTNDALFIVPDSREGWVALLSKLLKAHFYSGKDFTYSCMLLRSKGAPIKSFGGTASGPEILCEGIGKINDVLNARAGQKLRPIDALDVINIIGMIVVAGNVRRCIPAGSLVHLKTGLEPIENVKVGDEVLTSESHYYPVTNTFVQGRQELVKIITENGSFECTPNHRMAVISEESDCSYVWKEAQHLTPDDCLITGGPIYNDRDRRVNSDTARLIGAYTTSPSLVFRNYDDALHIKKQLEGFACNGCDQCKSTGVRVYSQEYCFKVSFSCVGMLDYLARIEYQTIHPFVLSSSTSSRLEFLRGVAISTNTLPILSYQTTGPLHIITTQNKKYAKSIHALLYSCGIQGSYTEKHNPSSETISLSEMMSAKQYCVELKTDKAKQLLFGVGLGFQNTPSFYREKVVTVETSVGNEETFDIEVADVHEFFCNGYLTHNSAILCLGDCNDMDYLRAKRWDLGNIPNTRCYSNNSVVCNNIQEVLDNDEFWEGYKGNGEPYGLINLELMRKCGRIGDLRYPDPTVECVNPCSEITLSNMETCVSGDTWIQTFDGVERIRDLVGKSIKIFNTKEWSEVVPFLARESDEFMIIEFSDGSNLKCTPYHEFQIYNFPSDSYSTANLTPESKYFKTPFYKVRADQLVSGMRLTHFKLSDFQIVEGKVVDVSLVPDNGYTTDMAYGLGVFAGDDYDVNNEIFDERFRECMRDNSRGLPDSIMKFSKTSILEFVRGWIEKSGTAIGAKKMKHYTISSPSKQKLLDLQILVRRIGIDWTCISWCCSSGDWILSMDTTIEITPCQDIPYSFCPDLDQRVVSITRLPREPSYCFSEPKLHMGIFNNVSTYQCCLADLFLPNIKTKEELFKCAQYAYRFCKHSLTLPCPASKETEDIIKKNQRIGVGITGYLQATEEQRMWLPECYEMLRQYDLEYSAVRGIPPSIKLTTTKPSGTLSIIGNVTSGVHPAYSRYYLRRIRISSDNPLVDVAAQHGHPIEYSRKFDGTNDYTTKIVSFPCKFPRGTILAKDCTAIQQLEFARRMQTDWSDNSVSVTVYYRLEELDEIKNWLRLYYNDHVKSVSFLLHNNHGFDQAPLEELTKEQYKELSSRCTPINDTRGICYREEALDNMECAGGACPIR